MLSYIQTFLFPPAPPAKAPTTTILVLRIPSTGTTPPHLLSLHTIDISSAGNIDSFLGHVPDLRSFWGSGTGWQWRDIVHLEIVNQPAKYIALEGSYYGFKSFALDDLPIHCSAPGACGDCFFVKVAREELDQDGWTKYEDVEEEILESELVDVMLKRLSRDEGGVVGEREINGYLWGQ